MKRSKILQAGYDIRTPDAGTVEEMNCEVCGDEMEVKRAVMGPTSSVEAMARKKHLHDTFTCQNAGTNWHNQVIKLKKAIAESPSAMLDAIFKQEIKKILKTRKATKIVHSLW